MGDISSKIQKFIEIFIDNKGYVKVVEGLKNTVIIAITGLIIGILIGTIIATVRVIPKYKRLPRVLDAICSVYVGFFRGTPMVVQLLLFYYVLLPIVGGHMSGVQVSMLVFGLNSGAYISEIMRSGILSVDPGQMEGGRAMGLSFATTISTVSVPDIYSEDAYAPDISFEPYKDMRFTLTFDSTEEIPVGADMYVTNIIFELQ